ncbi:MAG: hypothetical protein NZ898_04535 [Myxococcota bacterium]|nr:hypothetical protein [Myxococcota bacterium]MDW8362041.1 hypothetical protein [Myxococcales bacterium]
MSGRKPSRRLHGDHAALSLALVASATTGCNGAVTANLIVLALTVGIFIGTLALGRGPAAPRQGEATRSTHSQG